jgi:hypothetical protein
VPSFRARYIFENELEDFGLPDATEQKNILSLVETASHMIDEYCGRMDGYGKGSLVFTTYSERLLLQARNRNILRVSFKPMIAIPATTVNLLAASGSIKGVNNYYTGLLANTTVKPDTTLSPIIGCSGRYGYPRRGEANFLGSSYGADPLMMVAAFFGGPPNFVATDVAQIDFDAQTGEIWVPSGLYVSQYTEVVITYNSGFDPSDMPSTIKQACAIIVRNMLARGGGTLGLKSIQGQGMVNMSFSDDIIDQSTQRLLDPHKTVIAY